MQSSSIPSINEIIYVKTPYKPKGSTTTSFTYYYADEFNNPLGTSIVLPDADPTSWLAANPGVYLVNNVLNFVTLTKYTLGDGNTNFPHVGEKIPCRNWSLSVFPSGIQSKVQHTAFQRLVESDSMYIVFLKAHWGFVPTTD